MRQNPNIYNYKFATLTDKQIAITQHLALGKTAKEIAKHMLISYRTVESHVNEIKNKLAYSNRSELISILIQVGLVDISSKKFQSYLCQRIEAQTGEALC